MRARLAPFALVAAAVVAPVALAGDAPKLPWDGFGVGSFAHTKTTTTLSVPGVPPQTSEMKTTLVKVTDDAYVVKTESKVGEEWMGAEMPFPRKAPTGPGAEVKAPEPEALGDEDVTVDGKAYPCKKTRLTVGGATTVTWTHATEGVLKYEAKAQGTESGMVVTKLATKATVAGKELEVRESVVTMKATGMESKTTSWESRAVPGWAVRTEMVSDAGGMKTTMVTELVAFEAK